MLRTVELAVDTLAAVLDVRGGRQPVAAALGGTEVLADMFVVLGEPLDGFEAATGGERLPDGNGLWPVPGAAQQSRQQALAVSA